MPILGNFPGGGGSGSGGLQLAPVTGVKTLAAAGKVYVQWTDPDDLVVAGSTLAAWAGTILVRKAGSAPISRRDGVIVLDSKTKNAYQSGYFCDSGLTDGVTYYYKLFPYSNTGTYTDSDDSAFAVTPNPVLLGNVSGITLAAAGNGKMSIKWTDPAATVVEDGVTLATWASTIVVVKEGSYATSPTDPDAAFTHTSTTRNGHTSTPLVATGLTNGKTYYVSLFPMSTDGAANTNTANRKTGVANKITILTVPSQSGSLTFNNNPQSPVWSNHNTAQLTLGGETTGTNAGDYNATFTPTADYMWSDGSTTAKTVKWSIGKAAGSLSLSATTVTLNASALTGKVTVTRAGDGAITAISSDTSVATVSVSGNEVTISHVGQKTGTATITIKVAAGTNHNAPADKTVAVNAQFLPPVGTALNACSWSDIKQISDAGQGTNYWKVGDTKTIKINGTVGAYTFSNVSVDAYILGFNHNSAKEGANRIHFQLGKISGKEVALCDSTYNSYKTDGTKMFNFNHWGNYNYGGWAGSDLRYDILGSTNKAPSGYGSAKTTTTVGYDAPATTPTSPVANTLMAALPSDLRAVMKPVTKYTDNTAGGANTASYVTATADYLFLLAEFEVFGTRSYANSAEQNYQLQYDYYKAGNSKVAYNHSANSTAVWWWLRSPYYNPANRFCRVSSNGSTSYYGARSSGGLRPGFSV